MSDIPDFVPAALNWLSWTAGVPVARMLGQRHLRHLVLRQIFGRHYVDLISFIIAQQGETAKFAPATAVLPAGPQGSGKTHFAKGFPVHVLSAEIRLWLAERGLEQNLTHVIASMIASKSSVRGATISCDESFHRSLHVMIFVFFSGVRSVKIVDMRQSCSPLECLGRIFTDSETPAWYGALKGSGTHPLPFLSSASFVFRKLMWASCEDLVVAKSIADVNASCLSLATGRRAAAFAWNSRGFWKAETKEPLDLGIPRKYLY